MKYDPQKHNRQSIRMKEFDYSKPGAYFITICTNNHECLFGEIDNGTIHLSEFGKIVHDFWTTIPNRYENFVLDEFVVMPNHFHGIVIIKNDTSKKSERNSNYGTINEGAIHESPLHEPPRHEQSHHEPRHHEQSHRESPRRKPRNHLPHHRETIQHELHQPENSPNDPNENSSKIIRRKMLIPKIVGYFKMNTAKRINQIRNSPGISVWQRNYYDVIIRNNRHLYHVQ